MRYKSLGFREQGAGSREQGAGKREEGRGKREEGKNNVYLIAMIKAIADSRRGLPKEAMEETIFIHWRCVTGRAIPRLATN
ncbi:MAG: hypothetical protein F6K65_39465 [Moorea sp. SIO3C2]|nr:hypothetical protein [Moorena sp. SIO3C2]